jgi:AraC-like DNA-binding protein
MNENAFVLEGNKPVIEDRDLFERQFERLLGSAHQSHARNSEQLSWQAIGLLSHFVIDRHSEPTALEHRSKDPVGRAVEFIWNHTHKDVSVADVVRHVGCSRRSLEIRFKNSMQRTVLDEILGCRAERAMHLLKYTDLPIKQIVMYSGFQSREQMRLVFQKLLGRTPRDFRTMSKSDGP